MTTQDSEVIDRNGKRVRRDGIIQDGDQLSVPMRIMDAGHPGLAVAAALADAVKRNEQFDARGHRPGYGTQTAGGVAETARQERDARMRDAWRNPTPVLDSDKAHKHAAPVAPTAPVAELFAARDQAAADRDKRISEAWRT